MPIHQARFAFRNFLTGDQKVMTFDNGPFIWFDGKFVRWEDANIHVTAHVLHYGSSVFEGIRAYETKNGTAIFRLQPHAKRLVNGCKIGRFNLPWSQEEVEQAITETLRRNGQASCYSQP